MIFAKGLSHPIALPVSAFTPARILSSTGVGAITQSLCLMPII
jgi:hypothetical protein